MNKQEILTKAIEKAVEGGWQDADIGAFSKFVECSNATEFGLYEVWHGDQRLLYAMEQIIFSHDFAKAFWGEEKHESNCSGSFACPIFTPVWQHHLQQMILEEDPVGYLSKFI